MNRYTKSMTPEQRAAERKAAITWGAIVIGILLAAGFLPTGMVKLLGKQAWKKGMAEMKTWFGDAMEPARGWLETRYDSAGVQALFAPWVLHVGLTPEAKTVAWAQPSTEASTPSRMRKLGLPERV